MSDELALDFGTAFTRVVDGGGSLLFEEPTLAAVDDDTGHLIEFGTAAASLGAPSAGRVAMFRPVRRGQLVDISLTQEILSQILRTVGASRLSHPRVLVCAHVDATKVQCRALERCLKKAGARHVRFIEDPIACAVGADLALEEPKGSMTVDIGAGTTDIGVLALGAIVTSASVPVGGEDFSDAVRTVLARTRGLVVDRPTARTVCATIGSIAPSPHDKAVEVTGRHLSSGQTETAVLTAKELRPLLIELATPILEGVARCITTAPPDIANDLLREGLVLAGGGAHLDGIAEQVATAGGIPVHVSQEGGRLAVFGAARCLSDDEATNRDLGEVIRR